MPDQSLVDISGNKTKIPACMIFMLFMSGKNRQVKVTYVNYRDQKSQKINGSSIL